MMPRGGFDIDSISVRQDSGEIQYQYSGGDWKKIISLDELRGKDGRSIEVQKGSLHVQWRYAGESEWKNIIAYSDLKGKDGRDGRDGKDGLNGQNGKDGRDGINGKNGLNGQNGRDGQKGDKGDTGAAGPAGATGAMGATGATGATGAAGRNATISVTNSTQPCSTGLTITGNGTSNLGLQFTGKNFPAGGKINQVLGKKTDDDCDVEWKDTYEIRGTGMPEGNVKAGVGTYYTDTAATNGAIRWIKTRGSDKTGWKVVYGDTGWRSVPQILSTSMKASVVKVRRINNTVYLYAAITGWGSGWNGGGDALPDGLRPSESMQGPSAGRWGNSYLTWVVQAFGAIQSEAPSAQSPTPHLHPIVSVSYVPNDNVPWPTTLPGTAM
jgi:collagen triple helix repeat protein